MKVEDARKIAEFGFDRMFRGLSAAKKLDLVADGTRESLVEMLTKAIHWKATDIEARNHPTNTHV